MKEGLTMYLYDDEDNTPMMDEAWEAAREKAAQKKRDELEDLCGNCKCLEEN